MTLGGLSVIALTVLLAAADDALGPLLFALMLGMGVYAVVRRKVNCIPEEILEIQKTAMGQDETPTQKAENKTRREKLEKVLESQRWGNKEMAAVVGIAAFAYPPLGVVAFAAATSDMWLPPLRTMLQPAPERPPQAGYYTRNGINAAQAA